MAFTSKDGDINVSSRQRLNLSELAEEIVYSDMFAFRASNMSGFINRVFENFHETAEASISLAMKRYEGELEGQLERVPADDKTKRLVIKRLLTQKETSLRNKMSEYESGKSLLVSLNQKNIEYLSASNTECEEEKYYNNKRGKYIKCVMEEYARLSYVERERVYFAPFVHEVQYAVQTDCRLRVKTSASVPYSVCPYGIFSDLLSTANYLVGYSSPYNAEKEELCPCSFRLSAIKDVRAEKSKKRALKKEEKKQLDKLRRSRGVQFMVGNETEIHVRLTAAGKRKYERYAHLRPPKKREKGEDIYVFECTEAQAEFYFFKFGKDAEILQPHSLRDKLASMYEQAAILYSQTIEEE